MRQFDSVLKLINNFTKLPGVGLKTAQRYAFRIVEMDSSEVDELISAISEVKAKIRYCAVCGGFSEDETCQICKSRDKSLVCVVSYPKDILSIDRVGSYRGVFHVLGGVISPMAGKTPSDLAIEPLLKRLDGVTEVILATNPDVEGEATAAYLAKLLKPLGIKTTRLAQGISMGSDIEYADEFTLSRALTLRTEL